MMKIKIITIQYAHNYGAVLQAYSLKTYLERLKNKVEVVNYIPPMEKNKYVLKLRNQLGKKEAIKHHRIMEWIRNEIDNRKAQPEWEVRYKNFQYFIDDKLTLGKDEVNDVTEIDKDVDAFICGSDQIWNPVIVGDENAFYFLNFKTNAKKISYAASMGNPKVVYSKKFINDTLASFDAISVREDELKELLEESYSLPFVTKVCDPCLLLEQRDFLELIPMAQLESQNFVCSYYINDEGLLNDLFKKRYEIDGKQVIEIRWIRNYRVANKNQRVTLSVGEFLWYIFNCDTLYTDSFHGVVFAILFHKKFVAVYRENARIDALLTELNLKYLHINSLNECNGLGDINWSEVDKKVDVLRKKSKKFLEEALQLEIKEYE